MILTLQYIVWLRTLTRKYFFPMVPQTATLAFGMSVFLVCVKLTYRLRSLQYAMLSNQR